MSRSCKLFAIAASLLVLAATAAAQEGGAVKGTQEEAKPSALSTLPQLPNFLSSSSTQTLAVAGAVVVGVLGAAGVVAVIMYLGSFRPCYLFGTCDTTAFGHAFLSPYDAYPYSQPVYATYAKSYDGVNNELPYSYDAYPQHAAQAAQVAQAPATYPAANSVAANAYQKRSLEYVGPILKMLSNAYEKYNIPGQTKAIVESAKSTVSSGSPAEIQAE